MKKEAHPWVKEEIDLYNKIDLSFYGSKNQKMFF